MAQSSLTTTTEAVKKYLIYFGIFVLVIVLLQLCLNATGGGTGLGGGGSDQATNIYLDAADGAELGIERIPDMPNIPISTNSSPLFNVDNNFVEPSYSAVNIYEVEEPRERFATETKAKEIAKRFEFDTAPRREGNSNSILKWNENQRELTYDKTTQKLKFTNANAYPQGSGLFPRDTLSASENANRLIGNLGLNRPNLNLENIEINYLNRTGNNFEETSPGTAGYLLIRAYRKLEAATLKQEFIKDNEPLSARVVTEDYLSAPLEIIIAAGERGLLLPEYIYSAEFTDWSIEEVASDDPIDKVGPYSVITPEKAWENVENGKGSLQELTEFGFDKFQSGKEPRRDVLSFTASYLEVELAYLESEEWNGYFFPIYIFKGRAKLSNSPNEDNAEFVFYSYAIELE